MNNGRILMSVLMLAIFVAMVAVASQYPPQARFMPLVVGIPGIVLCILELARELRTAWARPAATDERFAAEQRPAGAGRRELVLWAYFIAFVAALILFGFWPSIPVFLLLFLRFAAGESWRFALGLGVVATAVLFLVFDKGLRVTLHPGFITGMIQQPVDVDK